MSPATAGTAGIADLSVEGLAGLAAEAVRALNHLTRPGTGTLAYPAELDTVVGELACLTGRLPQLLAQLAGWLHAEAQQGRLRVDDVCPHPDPGTAVAAAITALTEASRCATRTGRALDAGHQVLAHLAATSGDDEGEWGPR